MVHDESVDYMKKTLKALFASVVTVIIMSSVSVLADSPLDKVFQNAIDNYETTVDVSAYNMTSNEVMDAYLEFLAATPENFYVANTANCSYSKKTNTAKTLAITYTADKATAKAQEAEINAVMDKIAEATASMTASEKVQYVHDYLIANCSYDTTYNARSLYDAMVKGTGVCEGYTKAFQFILNNLGVECKTVTSNAMNHAWNVVTIDGAEYHVDVTWDDPIVNGQNTNTTAYYNYFMKSATEMGATHYGF